MEVIGEKSRVLLMRIRACGSIIDRVKGKLQRLMENIREKSGLGLTRSDELKSRGGRIEVGRVSYDGSYWRKE